ncbi:MAG: GGDEF domain-containing protein, partial [Ruminococcus sp.]|uniref:GAF domain-containing protein n=1 Tax=Ruminococcus sp. TaxID=41978 RepID=UPI001B12E32D
MDFQKLIDSFSSMACVVSVERKNGGEYGDTRLVAGNKLFIDMAEHPAYITNPDASPRKFVPNSLYDVYLPKAPDFESMCYRSAVLKKTVHTYIHPNMTNLWFVLYTIPLDYAEGDISYCIYSTEQCSINDIELAPSGSQGIANDVLKTCIRLRGASDFRKAMNEVIDDIRNICDASVCTLMLMNLDQGSCSILASSRKKNSGVRTISDYDNIYDIAVSWIDTISEGDCVIISNDKDMEYLRNANYMWYKAIVELGVSSIVLFPLRHNKELLGYIWASNFDTENSRRIKDTLELTTFFLSSEIA